MDFLSELEPEIIAQLSNEDFEDKVRSEAKSLAGEAIDTYRDVMNNGEDDKARVLAADRVLSISGIDSENKSLPLGVSEEVFKIAIAGFAQLASIARNSSSSNQILRDVSPAKSDPRKSEVSLLESSSQESSLEQIPLKESNEEIVNVIAKERYEIVDRIPLEDI